MNPETAWAIGDFLEAGLSPFDWIGNNFNDAVLLFALIMLPVWLRWQIKLMKKSKDEGTYV